MRHLPGNELVFSAKVFHTEREPSVIQTSLNDTDIKEEDRGEGEEEEEGEQEERRSDGVEVKED